MNRYTILATVAFTIVLPVQSHAAAQLLNAPSPRVPETLPDCGSIYAPPFAAGPGTKTPRVCAEPVKRSYAPKYRGLGYEVLTMESEACFLPDASFRLLDSLVDQAKASMNGNESGSAPWDVDAKKRLATVGDVLAKNHFGLFIPTETLGDALADRNLADGLTYMMDCDTSSLIYLTVAEEVSMPLSLVEITLPSGSGHNYAFRRPGTMGAAWGCRFQRVALGRGLQPAHRGLNPAPCRVASDKRLVVAISLSVKRLLVDPHTATSDLRFKTAETETSDKRLLAPVAR